MNKATFNQNDLTPCDWQYTVKHKDASKFTVGEKVFLSCNPNVPMTVCAINTDNTIVTTWRAGKETRFYKWPPHAIVQYKYAGLMTGKRKHFVSLN